MSPLFPEPETDADIYTFGLFGSYHFTDDFFVEGNLGYGFTDYTFKRNAVFQESGRAVPQTDVGTKDDTDGHQYWFSAGLGYDFHINAFSFGPYARATYVRSEIDDYTEDDRLNSSLEMKIDVDDRKSLTTDLGIRASYAIKTNWGVLLPHARVEWEHEFDKDAQTTTATYILDADGERLRLKGDDPDRNYFNLGGGLVAVLPKGWQTFADYEGLVRYDDLSRHRVTLKTTQNCTPEWQKRTEVLK